MRLRKMDEMTTHFNILLFLEVVIHSNLKKEISN